MLKEKVQVIQELEPITLDFEGIVDFKDNDRLFDFCMTNRDVRIERTEKGEIIIMSPLGGESGAKESILITELGVWNKKTQLGKVFASSTGFTLPNGAMISPDSAFIFIDRWKSLPVNVRKKFPLICPDFIIELRSESDNLKKLKDKMTEWMTNGCKLAWLIDPLEEKAYIYRPDKDIEEVSSFSEKLSGEDVLPHFVLDLSELIEEE